MLKTGLILASLAAMLAACAGNGPPAPYSPSPSKVTPPPPPIEVLRPKV